MATTTVESLPPATRAILEKRATAFRNIIQNVTWGDALQEMLAYADRAQDSGVRCGRLDMISHMIRAADTAGNLLSSENGGG